jgi:hypothetical protein
MPIFSIVSPSASGAVGSSTRVRQATWSVAAVLPQNATGTLAHQVKSLTYEPTSKFLFVARTGQISTNPSLSATTNYSYFSLGSTDPNKSLHNSDLSTNGTVEKWSAVVSVTDSSKLLAWMIGPFTTAANGLATKGILGVNFSLIAAPTPYVSRVAYSSSITNAGTSIQAWYTWQDTSRHRRCAQWQRLRCGRWYSLG